MKKIAIIVLFILFSCAEKGPKKPKDLIPKDQMTELLFDMSIANKTRNIKNIEDKKNRNYFALIFEKYKIDSTRFKASHEYYMFHIDEYRAIYKNVETKLDTLLKKQEQVIKIADSIKKAAKYKRDAKNDLKTTTKKPILKKLKK